MKSFYLIVFMLINAQFLYSQLQGQAKIDSLLKELPKMKKDTNAVNLLKDLSYYIYSINPDKGLEYAFQGVKLAKVIDWEKGEAKCYNSLGTVFSLGKSDYSKALEYYHKSLKIYEKLADKPGIATILGNIGLLYKFQLNYTRALEYYNKALKIDIELGNKHGVARHLLNIGVIYQNQPDYSKALEYYHKSLKIYEEQADKSGIASILGNIGVIYKSQLNYPRALEYYNKALKIDKELGNKNGVARHLLNIGDIYLNQSDYSKALEYYHKSLKIYEELGNKSGIASILGNIGGIYKYQSNYPKALEYYHKSLKIYEELRNNNDVAAVLNNIGIIYVNQSDYSKALEYYHKSLKIYEKLGNKLGVASNLGGIGVIHQTQSNYPKAFENYLKALKINEELGNKSGIGYNLGNIGGIYQNQSDYSKALEYYHKALKINGEIGKKSSVANNLVNIGIIYAKQSDYPKALEYYHNALKIYEEVRNKVGVANITINLGDLYTTMGEFDKSLDYLEKGLVLNEEIGDARQSTYTLKMLAGNYLARGKQIDSLKVNGELHSFLSNINSESDFKEAVKYGLQALKLADSIGLGELRYTIYKTISSAYEGLGQFEKGLEYHKKFLVDKDSVFNQENTDKLSALEKAREDDVNRLKIEKQEILLKAQEDEKQLIIYSAIVVVVLVILILALVINSRRKSNKLLLNVLPAKIAKRLKAKEHPIADHFDGASIMFVDIVGFTTLSSDADPKRIVSVLNDIFIIFDKLADKHGLEKIKTIGDAYMAVAGIPEIQIDHAKRTAQMALDIKSEMKDFKTSDGTEIKFRIGIDCGAVVAGVIGEKKFIYDLWSDAVNTASRMESTGESGQIQITENFKEELEKYDGNWNFTLRGEFDIKGKGIMKTYFLEENNLGEL